MPELDAQDRRLIDELQGGFPICAEPFAEVGRRLAMAETEVLERLQRLLDERVLTRFGPMYQIERMGGAFTLAALAVPEDRYEEVAAQVNALPQVAHNYRREHVLNMWFVLATETLAGIGEAIARIERETGLAVRNFPKEREYFVEMKLAVRT